MLAHRAHDTVSDGGDSRKTQNRRELLVDMFSLSFIGWQPKLRTSRREISRIHGRLI